MGNICGGSQTSATGGAPLVRSGSCLAPSYIVSKSSGILPAPSDIQHVFGPNHTLFPLSEPHDLRVFILEGGTHVIEGRKLLHHRLQAWTEGKSASAPGTVIL